MLGVLDRLADADGSGVRVVIIDSGVMPNHPWVGGRLVASYWVDAEGAEDPQDCRIDECEPEDVFGHGTAATGQVRRFAPNVDIVSMRILNRSLKSTSQALLASLLWLVDRNDVDIVNMSLSTQRIQFALRIGHIVDDLSAKKISCFCAHGYHGRGRAYPTSFASTFGVAHKDPQPQSLVKFRPGDLVEFEAAGVGVEVAWIPSEEEPESPAPTRVVDGSSYGCPLVAGLAARILSARPGLTPYELKSVLKAFATRQAERWHPDWMDAVRRPPVPEFRPAGSGEAEPAESAGVRRRYR